MGRGLVNRLLAAIAALLCAGWASAPVQAEDGYDLWLRYAPLQGEAGERLARFNPEVRVDLYQEDNPTLEAAVRELNRGFASFLSGGTNGRNATKHPVHLDCGSHERMGTGGFSIAPAAGGLRISGADHVACLYGAYALLRELAQGADPAKVRLDEVPAMPLRMLDHWDDPDGHAMRGYAGASIFDWWHLPEQLDAQMIDYARANASIGINAVVVNNVNASPLFLTDRYIPKLKRLADAWRPYGITLYISARFSAPRDVGGLATADPLDPAVRAWWKARSDALYAAIPDFGGFLVKANSEGQPGPQDYGRTHADGANMLAEALGPRGTVIWRAFVYSAENETDRAKQAYEEFVPLDGKFAPNVVLQVKNGPIDFQPREPFHPIFGAMPKTRLMLEAQVTREYLGQSTGIVYLAPMWSEVLGADTGHGVTVGRSIAPAGMAGVANTGTDRNWTGTHFDQANWYAFGRLAWKPALSPETIAREWAAQTFSRDPRFLAGIVPLMLESREATVDYMTPLGLTHQMATGHHYGPGPWVCDLGRPEWNPCYYSHADARGIGFDRTANGSNALEQYAPAAAAQWGDPAKTDLAYLLWFHHVAWDRPLPTGRTVWQELVHRYERGVGAVDGFAARWKALEPYVDTRRFGEVADSLAIQNDEAQWWRDASLAYWISVNGLELPSGVKPPAHDLDWYKAQAFPEAPGRDG